MPNTREKLMRLLCTANSKATEAEAFEDATYAQQLGIQADYLIANGVTIQKDYHWATEQAYKNGYEDGKPKWIPLSEQKPDRDSLVLVFFEGMRDTNCAIQVMYGWCMGGSASHWMPLPEPPKGE